MAGTVVQLKRTPGDIGFFKRTVEARVEAVMREMENLEAQTDAYLEQVAIDAFGEPDPSKEELFRPPETPCKVKCSHCGNKYSSSKIRLMYRPATQMGVISLLGDQIDELTPLWFCKYDNCDGAGYGFNIFPTEQNNKRKPS